MLILRDRKRHYNCCVRIAVPGLLDSCWTDRWRWRGVLLHDCTCRGRVVFLYCNRHCDHGADGRVICSFGLAYVGE